MVLLMVLLMRFEDSSLSALFDVVYTLAEVPRYTPLFYHVTRMGRRGVVAMMQREDTLGPARIAKNGIVRQAWPHGCLADDAVYGQLVPVQTETVTAACPPCVRRPLPLPAAVTVSVCTGTSWP
jgi:hypothetical protein